MDVNQNRPLLCLQTTVRNKCAEKVVSALAAALHVLCDQGGLKVLAEHGSAAVESTAVYLRLRAATETATLTAPRPLAPPKGEPVLPCFQQLFDSLQECFLDTRATTDDSDTMQDVLLADFSRAWSKHAFFELSQKVISSGQLLGAYCSYAALRLSLAPMVSEVLQLWAQGGLADLHACAWCHRSMLASLGFLYQDWIPAAVLQDLRLSGGGVSGQKFAESALTLLENQLKALIKSKQMAQLDSWHQSFQAARALLRNRLGVTPALHRKLTGLAFFSDLLPCLLPHSDGHRLLRGLADGLDSLDSLDRDHRSQQQQCLQGLARLAGHAAQDARLALQRILEDIFWSLRRPQMEDFGKGIAFVLEIIDSNGIFKECYQLITPAFGMSAFEGLLEVAHQTGQEPKLGQEFCKRVGAANFQQLPCSSWMEWQGDNGTPSSLPHLLYFAFRSTTGRKLLDLGNCLEQLRREAQRTSLPGNAYASVRAVARRHLLLEAAAAQAVRPLVARDGQVLLQLLGSWEEEESCFTSSTAWCDTRAPRPMLPEPFGSWLGRSLQRCEPGKARWPRRRWQEVLGRTHGRTCPSLECQASRMRGCVASVRIRNRSAWIKCTRPRTPDAAHIVAASLKRTPAAM
ncbi:unnamed protein product [Effrenium voratum]|nr:unnamed protein product [Effrenium voratum]